MANATASLTLRVPATSVIAPDFEILTDVAVVLPVPPALLVFKSPLITTATKCSYFISSMATTITASLTLRVPAHHCFRF